MTMASTPQTTSPPRSAPKKTPKALPQTIFYTEKRGATPALAPARTP
jgi:hypothetical protein